jgi:hypothetical protein
LRCQMCVVCRPFSILAFCHFSICHQNHWAQSIVCKWTNVVQWTHSMNKPLQVSVIFSASLAKFAIQPFDASK